jgi:general secretion pathway protein I
MARAYPAAAARGGCGELREGDRRPADGRGLPRGGCFDERGFTLLEVVIALAIASIALAVLYHGAVDGLLGSRLAARTDQAVARARSRLTALCHGARLSPGEQSGDDGSGYTWRTQITRAATETVPPHSDDQTAVPMRADLFAVRVILSWPGNVRPHQVSLETRCLSVGAVNRS